MSSPWLSIPLQDYEGHMSSANVQQLAALAELFKTALDYWRPESVAVLGVAGGNGLEQIDPATTKRIVGVDINQQYLNEVQKRFDTLSGLELYCWDLALRKFHLSPVLLVHAALIFEHTGLGLALENALSLVAAGGRCSVVLQLASAQEEGVSCTGYQSIESLKNDFALTDPAEFQRLMAHQGFQMTHQQTRILPAGKALWQGIFARVNDLQTNNNEHNPV